MRKTLMVTIKCKINIKLHETITKSEITSIRSDASTNIIKTKYEANQNTSARFENVMIKTTAINDKKI